MKQALTIHWFRQDLRLSDNLALQNSENNTSLMPIYILDDINSLNDKMGAASRWWLYHSLHSLNSSLNGTLSVYKGNPIDILNKLIDLYDVKKVTWNRCYEPWRISRDSLIKNKLLEKGVNVESFNGSLLWEPWKIVKNDGTPYKVFTPFYKKGCLGFSPPRQPLSKIKKIVFVKEKKHSLNIDDLCLLPNIPWDKKLAMNWTIGETGAQIRLQEFLKDGIESYKEGRNFPQKNYVSRLSPHLHFGEISPQQIWYATKALSSNEHIEHFCTELGWREFSYNQLYHFNNLPYKNLQSKFDNFPWVEDNSALKSWQQGKTGIPMVDAGMRELWQTGYMHNRVRMITGSFLVKNLLIHWHHGYKWFWDCLVDADLANNSASWQWIAGCGFDAAPYFRIFNPVTQGQKFDPEGDYIRRYLPELKDLPARYIFSPWEAPKEILQEARVVLGTTYPNPIVDLKKSRHRALEAFQSLTKDPL